MTELPSPDSLARQIVVRYRGDGHVRFGLPAALCAEPHAAAIEDGLRRLGGVYRVTLYRRQAKLSVFYDRHACDLGDVARALHGLLGGLAGAAPEKPGVAGRLRAAADPRPWLKRQSERAKTWLAEWRFKARLMKDVITYHPQMQGIFSERAILGFMNDLVTFYLIKVHWDLITQKWLKSPIKYRNAWLSTFYLVFLLVRSRKQAAKKQ